MSRRESYRAGLRRIIAETPVQTVMWLGPPWRCGLNPECDRQGKHVPECPVMVPYLRGRHAKD